MEFSKNFNLFLEIFKKLMQRRHFLKFGKILKQILKKILKNCVNVNYQLSVLNTIFADLKKKKFEILRDFL